FGWVSYALSRSERRGPGEAWRLFDFDQTHSLTAVASYEWHRFTVGARLRWATGAPRTPVVGAFYDARDDRFQPVFGAHNSIRIPDFFQLDLRVERRFSWPSVRADVYLDVQNLTGRANPEEIVYDYD